jgi:stage III sporulation protein AB
MLKILGAAAVMAGAAGMVGFWIRQQKNRIRRMKAFSVFLSRTYYAMGTEHVQMIAYLREYDAKDALLGDMFGELAEILADHTCPFGEQAWEQVCESRKKNWDVDEQTWEIITACGKALFGKNLAENLKHLKAQEQRMDGQIAEEERGFAEKRKILTPVGLLGGVMLIVILL